MNKETELLAPAGDFATALAAFAAGADAVYCGLSQFSARAFAKNLSPDELKSLVAYAKAQTPPRRVYVTFNTLLDERQLEDAVEILATLDDIRPDGVIVQDLGVARICRRHFPSLELHASTQLVAHNLEGVLAMKDFGFRRVVLARELSLGEVSLIARRCGALKIASDGRPETELECFVHGALCYSISGLCLFGAMEKGRSGNRGTCPYCCRLPYSQGSAAKTFPFSMRDLRLGEDALRLAEAGVSSLKIEGRMKSETYVASVTRYYRQILDREGGSGEREEGGGISLEDLETVFSRRTTKLYFDGSPSDPVLDPTSLGHLGAEIGVVKRVTRDPDGSRWLRFHTSRALEKHDGLQFENRAGGKPFGMGVDTMRAAISRTPVFEVAAGEDVEVLVPEGSDGAGGRPLHEVLEPGVRIYCSASQAVRRMFPAPSFRPGDCPGTRRIDVSVSLSRDGVVASSASDGVVDCRIDCELQPAKSPERTREAVRQAFSRLGGTDYCLGELSVDDPERLFAPPRVLNDLRRALVDRLDEARAAERDGRASAALEDIAFREAAAESPASVRRLKIRAGQAVPAGEWDEVVVVMGEGGDRVATPVYTGEAEFPKLRTEVKRLLRRGCVRWEAGDLATLRALRSLGVEDITADWTLFAFNSQALRELSDLGVRRFVASPENCAENLDALARSGFEVEFLEQQSTPLFMSLTEPASRPQELAVFRLGRLWVTTRPAPRTFSVPEGASARVDLSWDPA